MAVIRETAAMVTSDGVRLDADIWRPQGAGPLPVLLMRQPYGRAIASTVVYAHPAWYAARGYMVVIQDVRGRGTSGGVFRLCEAEKRDGAETVAWAAALPDSSGAVGMYGFSYQGMTQLFAAAARPPALKAIAPAMAAWRVREDFATEGDAFRLQSGLGWGCQLALETVRRNGDTAQHQAIFAASRALPLTAEIPCRPPIAAALGEHGHYLDWLTQPADARYWARVSPASAGPIDIPALHIGGWYDPLLGGTLACYRASSDAVAPQRLTIGPWAHIPWSRHVGERDFGPDAASDIDVQQVAWFDHWLKGTKLAPAPPVRLFELNGGWREFERWPDAMTEWRLTGGGRAGTTEADGGFGDGPPCDDFFLFDPWRPTPSVGGHAGHPAGPVDRTAADARSDVLTFTTPPLDADLHLAGDVTARLAISADTPSFDVHAVLSELPAGGGVFELTSGHRRIDTPPRGPVRVLMRATCARIAAGGRLRLSVAGGAFPAFAVNSGTGKPPAEERLIDQRIITLRLRHGAGSGSALMLPLVSGMPRA
jgi:putative CocE/NonD family hydrolase